MHTEIRKKDIFTVPNFMSAFRILLVPVLIWLYCFEKNYIGTVIVFTVSALTDIADGIIARKFNMISDLGKILDPVADKVTQGILIICLMTRYKMIILLLVLFCVKEMVMIIVGSAVIKERNIVSSAKWHGKINTVLLYFVIVAFIVFPDLPQGVTDAMIAVSACSMIVSLAMYTGLFVKTLKKG